MSAKTKIVVLRMKELIYTGIFALLGLLLILLLIVVFAPKKEKQDSVSTTEPKYVPGIYTTSLLLNDRAVDIEVTVDENNINDIRMVNLDDAVTTMFPLLEPAFDDLANQIVRNQSVSDIAYADDNKYTSLVLLDAIKSSLSRAAFPSPSDSPEATPSP